MCTVNIQVDEALLRDVKPELDSTAAIRLWAQELINLRIQELINEDEETMDIEEARAMTHQTLHEVYAMPNRDMTPEELYNVISDEIDYIYSKG